MKTEKIDRGFGSVMVIVPHQDDEILMCAGILESAAAQGLPAVVVMVTNGDYEGGRGAGRARLEETLRGLEALGVEEKEVEFLGYADTGMPREESFLYRLYRETDGSRVFRSRCSRETYGLPSKEEFHKRVSGVHASYTRDHLREDLTRVIEIYEPDNIFTTSEFDFHGDHSGLYLFIRDILLEKKAKGEKIPALYSGIVHSLAGDERWPVREERIGPYTCPDGFEQTSSLKWEDRIRFAVPEDMRTEDREQNVKRRALSCHVTALKPDAVDFLYSFIKDEELFWRIHLYPQGTP